MTPYLTGAESFIFESLTGERLDLFGSLLSWSGTKDFGIVEKGVVRRAGALHQQLGPGARKFEAKCLIAGPNCTADFRRIDAVLTEQPEGRVTHPRHGSFRAVVHSMTDSETPGDEKDAIYVTLKISETGLYTPPKPSPAAKSAEATAKASQTQAWSTGASANVTRLADVMAERANGLQLAMLAAETGQGTLADIDATISTLVAAQLAFESTDAPELAKRAAAECLALVLASRAAYQEGRPRIVEYQVSGTVSLTRLCQMLYGSKAAEYAEEVKRLNRITRPYALSDGLKLQIIDPSYRPRA